VAPPSHAFRVDGGAVGYAGFERRGDTLALVRAEQVDLDPETFQEGLLGGPAREPAGLRGRVAELVQRLDGVREAALVLPDAWLRLAFVDVATLPAAAGERDEVLRWKLKRLVPFRVEELRLAASEVAPLPGQNPEEPHRLLLGFGIDSLLTQLEEAFAAAGVRLGRMTSESLALLSAVAAGGAAGDGDRGLTALALVADGGYTLAFVHRGLPVLHRYKGFAGHLPDASRGGMVSRDLRLTRTFLEDSLPGLGVDRALVAAPAGLGEPWLDWLGESLEAPAELLTGGDLPPVEMTARGVDWQRLAPLVGAVSQEVAV
jgi:hypothetical protein